jgi:CheY-like chemotaxis protein
VTTAPGHTTVEALWPAVGEQPLAVDQPEAPPAAPKSRGKALVIDDEMFVREVAASALQELGYEPLLAGDGQTAFQLFLKHRSEVRLVVLDVMMPGMTGDQVLEALRTVNPTLPAVVMSGYTDRRAIRTGPGTRTEFLQKPFHPEELFAIAEQLLKTGV